MADLQEISVNFHGIVNDLQLTINGMRYASADHPDSNLHDDLVMQAAFIKAFTEFENSLELIFLHYSVGNKSLALFVPDFRLRNCSELQARDIVKSDSRYLDWSSVSVVRERAKRFFSDGEPFLSTHGASADALARAERIRNRIAHNSLEARAPFQEVILHHFKTGRIFDMQPGQLLRSRLKKPAMHIGAFYLGMFAQVIDGLIRKAP